MTMTDTGIDVADGEYSWGDAPWVGMVREDVGALVAATFPARPPTEWFSNPKLREPTPLTISNDGRVYGHIATWRQSHIGMAGGVRPPKSRSNYAFFATGVLETAEGNMVNVGQITLAGGHAPLEASVAEAVAHYDNTQSAVMDVAIGEDRIGVWAAGALRPDIDEVRLRSIRASSVSGDWRPINGGLELVAVCAVNVPGFPIPRARVASGQTVALVAAGTEDLAYAALLDRAGVDIRAGITAGLNGVDQRVKRVEEALLATSSRQRLEVRRALQRAKTIAAAAEPPAPEDDALRESLRARVRGDGTGEVTPQVGVDLDALRARVRGAQPAPPTVEELRARVHPDVEPDVEVDEESDELSWGGDLQLIEASAADVHAIALRMRVRGGVTATATSALTSKVRENAAKKGQAMKDGSFPIRDKTDLKKAIKACGRAKNIAAAKRHIKKRARALGATDLLPDSWK